MPPIFNLSRAASAGTNAKTSVEQSAVRAFTFAPPDIAAKENVMAPLAPSSNAGMPNNLGSKLTPAERNHFGESTGSSLLAGLARFTSATESAPSSSSGVTSSLRPQHQLAERTNQHDISRLSSFRQEDIQGSLLKKDAAGLTVSRPFTSPSNNPATPIKRVHQPSPLGQSPMNAASSQVSSSPVPICAVQSVVDASALDMDYDSQHSERSVERPHNIQQPRAYSTLSSPTKTIPQKRASEVGGSIQGQENKFAHSGYDSSNERATDVFKQARLEVDSHGKHETTSTTVHASASHTEDTGRLIMDSVMAWSKESEQQRCTIKDLGSRICMLQKEKEAAMENAEKVKRETTVLKRRAEYKMQEVDEIMTKWKNHRKLYKEATQNFNDNFMAAITDLKPARDFVTNKVDGLDAFKDRVYDLRARFEQIVQAQKEITTVRDQANRAEARLKGVEEELRTTTIDLSRSTHSQELLQCRYDRVGDELHKVQDELQSVKMELQGLQDAHVALRLSSERESVRLQTALEGECRRVEDKQELLSKAQAECVEIKERSNELRRMTIKATEDHQKELTRLEVRYVELEKAKDIELVEVRMQLAEQETLVVKKEDQNSVLELDLQKKEQELSRVANTNKELETKVQELDRCRDELKGCRAELQEMKVQTDRANGKIAEQKVELSQLKLRIDDVITKGSQTSENWRRQAEEAKELAAAEKAEGQEMLMKVQSTRKDEIKKHQEEMQREIQKRRDAEQEGQKTAEELQMMKNDLKHAQESLRREIRSKKTVGAEWEEKIKDQDTRLQALSRKLEAHSLRQKNMAERYQKGTMDEGEAELAKLIVEQSKKAAMAELKSKDDELLRLTAELAKVQEERANTSKESAAVEAEDVVSGPGRQTKRGGKASTTSAASVKSTSTSASAGKGRAYNSSKSRKKQRHQEVPELSDGEDDDAMPMPLGTAAGEETSSNTARGDSPA